MRNRNSRLKENVLTRMWTNEINLRWTLPRTHLESSPASNPKTICNPIVRSFSFSHKFSHHFHPISSLWISNFVTHSCKLISLSIFQSQSREMERKTSKTRSKFHFQCRNKYSSTLGIIWRPAQSYSSITVYELCIQLFTKIYNFFLKQCEFNNDRFRVESNEQWTTLLISVGSNTTTRLA